MSQPPAVARAMELAARIPADELPRLRQRMRWVLFAGAVFLPYIAVIFANQAHQRPPGDAVGGGDPGDAPAITTGEERGQIISGEIITDDEEPDDRVA